jgi:hypothetical protein
MARIKKGGRTKGTPNKLTVAIRETLAEVLTDYSNETLRSDLNDLTSHERIKAITNLYRLTLPPIKQELQEDNEDIRPIIINLGNGINPAEHL